MNLTIKDADGRSVSVDSDNRLRVSGSQLSAAAAISRRDGEAYVWAATADWGADKNAMWLRNDSKHSLLYIDAIQASLAAAAVVEIWVGNGNASGGTAVVGVGLNRSKAHKAEVTCTHTNTNVDAGSGMTLLAHYHMPATTPQTVPFGGALVLGYLDEVAVNIVTDVGASFFNITGWFGDKED